MMLDLFGTSAFYGHSSIIKKYCNIPSFIPLPFAIQHGWAGGPSNRDLVGGARKLWVWSERDQQIYGSLIGSDNCIVGGAPFIYLLHELGLEPFRPSTGFGTIAFPAHSSEWVHSTCDDSGYASYLKALPEYFHPITVCLYYVDLERGRDVAYREHGLNVTSVASSRLDPRFLHKFVSLTRSHRYALFNSFSSAALYASALGLVAYVEAWDFHRIGISKDGKSFGTPSLITNETKTWLKSITEDFFRFPDADLLNQQKFVSVHLGYPYMMSPFAILQEAVSRLSLNYFQLTSKMLLAGLRRRAFGVT